MDVGGGGGGGGCPFRERSDLSVHAVPSKTLLVEHEPRVFRILREKEKNKKASCLAQKDLRTEVDQGDREKIFWIDIWTTYLKQGN
ncbi:hypothetical protein NECAME_14868 [Necator americanus]|uniref:Uncharacterized protein n=1 Tax=Necator americanus TaxID=51031 RepID=W2SKY2_NECAM|nr:hypothetical protein NECAME_14868 [Necator americanus]ETN70314.1 hypothetical protein NECAME_14868 [Necator americanus]